MTIKESRFIANSFRAYCVRYNHMPVFFPLATGAAADRIRSRPFDFERLVQSFYYNALREMRGLDYYEYAIEELQEICFLASNPAECKYYFMDGAVYKTVREYAAAQVDARKSGEA